MRTLCTLFALSLLMACSSGGRGGSSGGAGGAGGGNAGGAGGAEGVVGADGEGGGEPNPAEGGGVAGGPGDAEGGGADEGGQAGEGGEGAEGAQEGGGDEGHEGDDACVDIMMYPDEDGDGWGVEEGAETMCVKPGESKDGMASNVGDCEPQDPWMNNGAEEICADHTDDNCDPSDDDDDCPESRPAGLDIPQWDCVTGDPPANVRAWAHFPDGGGFFMDGACVMLFEGIEGEFYVRWQGLAPSAAKAAAGDCSSYEGCICPGSPPWDRRLYAFMLRGSVADCDDIEIRDHAGNDQSVSNHCRKYLYALHTDGDLPFFAPDGQPAFDLPFSYVSGDEQSFRRRLELFPTVEIACAANPPNRSITFASLLTASLNIVEAR